jgi:hypothetical protein
MLGERISRGRVGLVVDLWEKLRTIEFVAVSLFDRALKAVEQASSWYLILWVGFGRVVIGRLLRRGQVEWIALRTQKRFWCSIFCAQLELLLVGARLARLARRCALMLPLMLPLLLSRYND